MTVIVNPAITGPENSAGGSGGGGGGGGVSLFTELTDATSANLPADNGPLAAALAVKVSSSRQINTHPLTNDIVLVKGDVGLNLVDNTADVGKPVSTAQQTALNLKADKLGTVDLGTGVVALSSGTHANRHCFWHGTADTSFTFDPTGAVEGDAFEVSHTGVAGVISLPTASPPGYKNQISPGEIGTFEWTGGSLQSAIPSSTSATAIAVTTGGVNTGNVRTCTPATGWVGTFQWLRDGVAISGATSSTYTMASADETHQVTCKFIPASFITNGVTGLPPADVTPPTLVSATIPSSSATTLNLVFSEALNATMGAATKWAIAGHVFTTLTVDSTTTAHLTTGTPFVAGATYNLAYTQDGTNDVKDVAGNLLANIAAASVTNSLVSTMFSDNFAGSVTPSIDGRTPNVSNAEGATWVDANVSGALDGAGMLNLVPTASPGIGVKYPVTSRKDFTITIPFTFVTPTTGLFYVHIRDNQISNVTDSGANSFAVAVDNTNVYIGKQYVSGTAGSWPQTVPNTTWAGGAEHTLTLVMDASNNLQVKVDGSNVGSAQVISGVNFGMRIRAEGSQINVNSVVAG